MHAIERILNTRMTRAKTCPFKNEQDPVGFPDKVTGKMDRYGVESGCKDFQKSFDSVSLRLLDRNLKAFGVGSWMVQRLKVIYFRVRVEERLSNMRLPCSRLFQGLSKTAAFSGVYRRYSQRVGKSVCYVFR